jgi:hypothetical protein
MSASFRAKVTSSFPSGIVYNALVAATKPSTDVFVKTSLK